MENIMYSRENYIKAETELKNAKTPYEKNEKANLLTKLGEIAWDEAKIEHSKQMTPEEKRHQELITAVHNLAEESKKNFEKIMKEISGLYGRVGDLDVRRVSERYIDIGD